MKSTSSAKRSEVMKLLMEGESVRNVERKTGVGKSIVGRIKKDLDLDKENNPGGRPSKLSPRDAKAITRQIASGRMDNAVEVTQYLNTVIPNTVTPQTVRNSLKKDDYHSVTKKKCPLLKKKHRKDRLKFAREHQNWTVDDWKRVLWSDETKINRIGSDGKVYTWKKKGEKLSDRTTVPTVKHGGGNNLMVWGCMGWNGVGMLVEVQGIMDSEQYCEILEEGLEESFEKLELVEGQRYFMQDNDPKHTAKRTTKWLKDRDIEVLTWPAQSPDLNPLEHLWFHVKGCLKKYSEPAKGVHELWERVVDEWNKIEPEVCQNLIESMPRRIEAVLAAKGGHTKY